MPSLHQISSYVTYWLDAVDRHSLHSPFLYDFYTRILRPKTGDVISAEAIEALRKKLLDNQTPVAPEEDFGAGAMNGQSPKTIATIAARSLSTPAFSSLYGRIAAHFRSRNIIELGTSLGINTLYLARTPDSHVTTFEGSPVISAVASDTFAFAGAANITQVIGNIDETLPRFLDRHQKIDLVFMDANHRYEPTRLYFQRLLPLLHAQSVLIIDDIHYTPEMEKAWNEIKQNELVYTTIDLYRAGIVFFDPSLNKQHVVLQI